MNSVSRPSTSRGLLVPACVLSLATVISGSVEAAWVVEPAARAEVRHDDNVRLSHTEEDEEDGLVNTVTGQLTFRQVTERSDVSALIGATYLNYSSVDLDDEDNQFLAFRGRWDAEAATYGLRGTVRRDVLLRTADVFDDFGDGGDVDLGGIGGDGAIPTDDIDVGAVETQIRRIRTQVQPFVDFNLGARTGLGLSYQYYGNDYDEEPGVDVQDSDQHQVAAELSRSLSEISTLRLKATAGRFDPEVDETVDTYEVVVGLDRQFSDRFFGSVEVGGRRAETDLQSDNGLVVRLRGTQQLERGQLRASLERSLIPSTFGDMVERDTVRFAFYREMTDRVSFNLESRAYRIERSADVGSADRDYFEIEPRIERALSQSWAVGLYRLGRPR